MNKDRKNEDYIEYHLEKEDSDDFDVEPLSIEKIMKIYLENRESYSELKTEFKENIISKVNEVTPSDLISVSYSNKKPYESVKPYLKTLTNKELAYLGYIMYQNLGIILRHFSFRGDTEINFNSNITDLDKDLLKWTLFLTSAFANVSHNFNYSAFVVEEENTFKYEESFDILSSLIVFSETVLDVCENIPYEGRFLFRDTTLESMKEHIHRRFGDKNK